MLNAQSKEKLIPSIGTVGETASAGSFGTVLNSVQGLQQRLGDFSVDEISEAEASVRTLIARLSEVVRKLDRIAEVQRSVADARKRAVQAGIESPEIPNRNVFDNSLPIHAIAQANNLIPFPRPKKVLTETSENPPLAAAVKLEQDEGLQSEPDRTADHPEETSDIDPENQARELGEALVPDLTSEQALAIQPEANEAPIFPAMTADDSALPQEDFPSHTSEEDLNRSEIARIFAEDFNHMPGGEATELLETAPPFEFAKQEEHATETKGGNTAGADFDQRLLDDLIKNYGEFVASPTASAQAEAPTAPSRPPRAQPVHRDLGTPETTQAPGSGVPGVRREGQLDRELKKIIKDYGEVDLYSRQSPINFKIAGIAAFLLLGALVAGFYFFYSPNRNGVGNTPEVRSTADHSSMGSGASKESAGKEGMGIGDRTVTTGESDRTIERGDSQSPAKKNLEDQNPS
jgi:hypothetical protein